MTEMRGDTAGAVAGDQQAAIRGEAVLPEERLRALAQLFASLAASTAPHMQSRLASLAKHVGPARRRAEQAVEGFIPTLRAGVAAVGEIVLPVVEALSRLEEERPPNWPSAPSFPQLRLLVVQEGLPVTWVPNADLLRLLLKAPTREARRELLTGHQAAIVTTCREVLAEVISPDLQDARDLVTQAVDCVIAHPAPAQALSLQAAPILASDETSHVSLRALGKHIERLNGRGFLPRAGQVQTVMTLLAVAPLLVQFWPERGDAVPEWPNRHAVAHALDSRQYTKANALISVMVAVSVLRQAEANRREPRLVFSV